MEAYKLVRKVKEGKGLTHPSTFHADDVLSTCLFRILNPDFQVIRSNAVPDGFSGIVYDVGLGEYDHHQIGAKERSDGTKYAAFGLLWKDLGRVFMEERNAGVFDRAFVYEIDRCDNTSNTNVLSSSIAYFNRIWNKDEDDNVLFERAVRLFTPYLASMIRHFKSSAFVYRYVPGLEECLRTALVHVLKRIRPDIDIPPYGGAKHLWETYGCLATPDEDPEFFEKTFLDHVGDTYGKCRTSPIVLMLACAGKKERIRLLERIMERRIESINALAPAREACEDVYRKSERKDIIALPRYIPYDSLSENHETVKFILFPSGRDGYTIIPAKLSMREKEQRGIPYKTAARRAEFPAELRGRKREELENYCKGLFFVHPSGIAASCDDLESGLEFAGYCLRNRRCPD